MNNSFNHCNAGSKYDQIVAPKVPKKAHNEFQIFIHISLSEFHAPSQSPLIIAITVLIIPVIISRLI